MSMISSHERLNAISLRLGGIERYLEIGVAKGNTFFNVEASDKHAVDPRFRFDIGNRSDFKNETFHSVTSDEYFSKSSDESKPFDLIFLDGLHTYNQTLKDFLNSLAVAHKKTIWLIDDTVPRDAISAEPSLDKVKSARSIENNDSDQTWMGDVFKVVVFIDHFFSQYTCLTLKDHGQTVVLPISSTPKTIGYSTEEIDKLTYVDSILMRETLFKPIEFETVLQYIDKIIIE